MKPSFLRNLALVLILSGCVAFGTSLFILARAASRANGGAAAIARKARAAAEAALVRNGARSVEETVFAPRSAHCATECLCSRGGVRAYGRYCGFRYTGCDFLPPCDAVDACCYLHDMCVTRSGKLADCDCATAFVRCLACAAYFESANSSYTWNCDLRGKAAATMMGDVMYLLPACYDEAERQLLATAIDFEC